METNNLKTGNILKFDNGRIGFIIKDIDAVSSRKNDLVIYVTDDGYGKYDGYDFLDDVLNRNENPIVKIERLKHSKSIGELFDYRFPIDYISTQVIMDKTVNLTIGSRFYMVCNAGTEYIKAVEFIIDNIIIKDKDIYLISGGREFKYDYNIFNTREKAENFVQRELKRIKGE
jgi:hypothetical protein